MSVATVRPTTSGAEPAAIRLLPDPGKGRPVDRSEPDLLRYLSASRLKCWQTCRRQFYYRYVERLVVPTAPALFIGRQIHEVLRQWNWAKWKSAPLTPEQLHAALTESWERDAAAEFISWKTPDDEAIARDQSGAMLEAYFAQCPVAPDEHPEGVEVQVESVASVLASRLFTASSTWCDPADGSSTTSRRLVVPAKAWPNISTPPSSPVTLCFTAVPPVNGKRASSCITSSRPKCRR